MDVVVTYAGNITSRVDVGVVNVVIYAVRSGRVCNITSRVDVDVVNVVNYAVNGHLSYKSQV